MGAVMRELWVYEIYLEGKYIGWFECEEMAKSYCRITPNARYKGAWRLVG